MCIRDSVEAENKEKLLAFYENYGFKRFDTRQTVLGDAESVSYTHLDVYKRQVITDYETLL